MAKRETVTSKDIRELAAFLRQHPTPCDVCGSPFDYIISYVGNPEIFYLCSDHLLPKARPRSRKTDHSVG